MPAITKLTYAGAFTDDTINQINTNLANVNIVLGGAANTGAPTGTGSSVLNTAPTIASPVITGNTVNSASLDPQTIQYVSVPVSNALVKTLFSVGVPIIAAQGAGTLIEVLSYTLENVYGTAQFTAGGAIQLSYGAGVTIPASATVAATFLTSPTAKQVIVAAGALASNLFSAVGNTAIRLACATQEFATGDGTMVVKVAYRVHSGL